MCTSNSEIGSRAWPLLENDSRFVKNNQFISIFRRNEKSQFLCLVGEVHLYEYTRCFRRCSMAHRTENNESKKKTTTKTSRSRWSVAVDRNITVWKTVWSNVCIIQLFTQILYGRRWCLVCESIPYAHLITKPDSSRTKWWSWHSRLVPIENERAFRHYQIKRYCSLRVF